MQHLKMNTGNVLTGLFESYNSCLLFRIGFQRNELEGDEKIMDNNCVGLLESSPATFMLVKEQAGRFYHVVCGGMI